jgi:hypothetical protein
MVAMEAIGYGGMLGIYITNRGICECSIFRANGHLSSLCDRSGVGLQFRLER